jgi:hypothetical protein
MRYRINVNPDGKCHQSQARVSLLGLQDSNPRPKWTFDLTKTFVTKRAQFVSAFTSAVNPDIDGNSRIVPKQGILIMDPTQSRTWLLVETFTEVYLMKGGLKIQIDKL